MKSKFKFLTVISEFLKTFIGFKLSLNEKTEGVYFVGNSKLPLHFFLKKIKQNDLDIEIEYDIYSHEQLLSCNTLEIEVKKC